MNQDITPKQALFLWKMIAGQTTEVREPMQSKATPKLAVKERQALVDKGYLAADKRGSATYLALTDKAWSWAGRTHDVQLLQSNSKVGAEVLQALLTQLLPFLHEHELTLASLFAGRKANDAHSDGRVGNGVSAAHGPAPLLARVEDACLRLSGGRRKQRVRLCTLRDALTDVPRDTLDRALLDLQDAGRAVLYRDDNSAALSDADHAAALVVGDAPRHIIYLEA